MTEVRETDVRARLDEVSDLIDRYTLNLAMLRKELDDLQVAVRVFERFHERRDYAAELVHETGPAAKPTVTAAKPAVLPTVPEMIVEALGFARDEMKLPGWEPKTILGFIRDRYWPEAQQTSVGPIAWRMAQEGRLLKRGTLYCLPENETPAGPTAGVSEPEDEDGSL